MTRIAIGLRLTLWYFAIFACSQLVFGTGVWLILRQDLYDLADDALEDHIDDARHRLDAQPPDASLASLQQKISETYSLEHSGDYLQIRDQQGNWIYRSAFLKQNELPGRALAELQIPTYEDRRIGETAFRFLSQVVEAHGQRFAVQTAVPESDILQTLTLFQRDLPLFAAIMLVAASAAGYGLSRRALAPVDAMTRAARNISGSNLNSRLKPVHTGDELERLSLTLNEMLERLETAFLRISQFTADASHELRTPVSLIRTEAEIALRKPRIQAQYREALSHILHEAERTSALIEELLTLARADAGREFLDMQMIDLHDLIERAARDWRIRAAAQGLQFVENLDRDGLTVTADKTALARLMNILLENAVRYTPSPGKIEIKLQHEDGNALIMVSDTGIGISQEDQAKIFERFYRADKARHRESGGSGLGLAIARWIVEQHNGSIAVTSVSGAGSTFVVRLPMASSGRNRLVS